MEWMFLDAFAVSLICPIYYPCALDFDQFILLNEGFSRNTHDQVFRRSPLLIVKLFEEFISI